MEGVVEQILRFESGRARGGVARVLLGEDQVEVAGLEGRERLLRFQLGDVHAQPRMPLAQQTQRRRDQGQGRRLERGDTQGAGQLRQRGGDVRLRTLKTLQHRLRVGDEDLGLLGQPHPPPDRLQQLHPDLGLQLRELLGDGGGRVRQGRRDGRQRAAVLELAQQPQSVQIKHRRSLIGRILRRL